MKNLILIATGVLAGALILSAQQGQGGPPLALNDADKDGVCDITGQPVGQRMGMGRMAAQDRRGGQGRGGARNQAGTWGRGGHRAAGHGFGRFQQQNTPQPQSPEADEKTQQTK